MTLEDAIKFLKQYQGYEPMFPDGETLKHAFDLTDETVDTLLTALRPVSRERVEKVRRGEWERITDPYGHLEGFLCKCGTQTYSASNFCPHCGGAKTDEAVDMMLERWKEAVSNENS